MTILASQADAAVVVQADYYSPDEGVQPPAIEQRPSAMTLAATANATLSRPASTSPFWNPIRLYLRTQGNLGSKPLPALLDVLA
jgi:hypothetical protein